jgi:hypothetical protein
MNQKSKSTVSARKRPASPAIGLRKAAAALGLDPGQLSREASRPGFPRQGNQFDIAAIAAWRAANTRQRKTAATSPSPIPRDDTPPDPNRRTLVDAAASPLQKAEAAMNLLAGELADGCTPVRAAAFKTSLQELRQSKAAYIELAREAGQLLSRDLTSRMLAECCTRLVSCLTTLQSSIAGEVEVWLADDSFKTKTPAQRRRIVGDYVAAQCSQVRRLEADKIDAMITAAAAASEEQ